MKNYMKIGIALLMMFGFSYCALSQTMFDDSLLKLKQRNEAFDFYSSSYKSRTNKEVYVQEIRQPEVKQIVVNNYYDSYEYPYSSRIRRFSNPIVNYGYFGSYYIPYKYTIPIIRIGNHRYIHQK